MTGVELQRFFSSEDDGLSPAGVEEDLLAGVAHDLINQLVPARLFVDSLQMDAELADSLADRVRMIDQSLELAASLARKMLSFTKGEGSAPIRLELGGLLADVRRLTRALSGSVEPRIDVSDTTPWVSGQPRNVLLLLLATAKAGYDLLAVTGCEGHVGISVSPPEEPPAAAEVKFSVVAQETGVFDGPAAFEELCASGCPGTRIALQVGPAGSGLAAFAEALGGSFRAAGGADGVFCLTVGLPRAPDGPGAVAS